ncbi:MAG: hypothetical protein GC181_12910 [Bacteroidetes bacterium]|nr:hypothetical protein [Bacteroidota bacterium]
MQRTTIWILFSVMAIVSQAQNYGTKDKYTFLDRNLFTSYRTEWFEGVTPKFNVNYVSSDGQFKESFPANVAIISLVGMGFEPRINLINFRDKASISFSVPADAHLAISVSNPDDEVSTGFFAASIGFFTDFNMGNHATYNNIDRKGYSVGIGLRTYKAPFFRLPVSDRHYSFPRVVKGISLRFQYKEDFRNGNNKIWYFESGIPQTIKQQKGTFLGNTYLLFGMGKILNY